MIGCALFGPNAPPIKATRPPQITPESAHHAPRIAGTLPRIAKDAALTDTAASRAFDATYGYLMMYSLVVGGAGSGTKQDRCRSKVGVARIKPPRPRPIEASKGEGASALASGPGRKCWQNVRKGGWAVSAPASSQTCAENVFVGAGKRPPVTWGRLAIT